MTLRKKKRLVELLAGTLVLGSMAFFILAFWQEDKGPRSFQYRLAENQPLVSQEVSSEVSRQDQAVWSKELRRPLYDPPPPPPRKEAKRVLPPLRSKLLGTILEQTGSQAMIEIPGGKVEFRKVGEELGPHDEGATIKTIGPSSITILREDKTTELSIDRGY